MSGYADEAVNAVLGGHGSFCKFLTANDTGLTGGHQAGIHVPKPCVPVIFDTDYERGENQTRWAHIEWQDGTVTESRFIYYGQKTRNEYRITNFGRGFEFLRYEYTGALFVLVRISYTFYRAFVLNTDAEIIEFLEAFGMTPADTGRMIGDNRTGAISSSEEAIDAFISKLIVEFPEAKEMSAAARMITSRTLGDRFKNLAQTDPDRMILLWTSAEFDLFRALEYSRYGDMIKNGFDNVEDFVSVANMVLNRRKSRAGKSLENHLAALFDSNHIEYTAQAVTEGHKRPDFIFPSIVAYHDPHMPDEMIASLAAKTTCKDRWRQILNEADRLRGREKFLCTLQQGISPAQLEEMEQEKVILVVPAAYIKTYPAEWRSKIWSLSRFIAYRKHIMGET